MAGGSGLSGLERSGTREAGKNFFLLGNYLGQLQLTRSSLQEIAKLAAPWAR